MTGATYTASTQAATDASSVAANLASGHAVFTVPPPQNEPTLAYRPGSPEREALKASLKHLTEQKIDVPVVIGSEVISSGEKRDMRMPHAHAHLLGHYHCATRADLDKALAASAKAKPAWAAMPWQDRAAIFLKAADLLAGPYRSVLNAVTMAAQSKTAYQAEIDSACELIDFIRFNVHFMQQIYQQQPVSSPGVWNRMEYRPLEGFVLAVTPFNFTAIAGNLPMSAALMGNTVIWKPASSVVYTAWHVMKLWEMAGLPEGVITMMAGPANEIVDPLLEHPDLAGVHFTGSTAVFHHIWKRVGENIGRFRTYPRLVGETGGKDFVFAHASADPIEVATALVRGAFEFQGQKCSAASRAYIPHALWPRVREHLLSELAHVKVGDVADFRNFMGAVIDREAFQRIKGFIDFAKADDGCETIAEGTVDDSLGYFVAPHVFRAHEPDFRLMREEIFGPVLTVYVYDEKRFEETLAICDQTSPYALTGAIFARDRRAIAIAAERLQNAAGNFYINDKPTGAVVGQQPFGGGRASGTNDKAGSVYNLLRWVSPRTIKETFVPPTNFRYPFMEGE